MTVSKKLFGGFSLLIIISIIVGVIGIIGMNRTRLDGISIYENQVVEFGYVNKSSLLYKDIRLDVRQAVISSFYNDRKGAVDIQRQFEDNVSLFLEWFNRSYNFSHNVDSEMVEFHVRILDLFEKSYLPNARLIIDESIRDIPDHYNKLSINVRLASLTETTNRIENLITGLIDLNSALAKQTSNRIAHVTQQLMVIQLLMLVIAVIAAVISSLLIVRSIALPIRAVMEVLKEMGEGNLTRRLSKFSNDEIGEMSKSINVTAEKIKALVLTIRQQASVLLDIGNDLSGNMTKTVTVVDQITSSIQTAKNHAISQSASVDETNATMEQVTVNINKLNEHVEKQSFNVSQASSAIEQMVANIHSVSETLNNNAGNVHALKEASESGNTGLQEVTTDIQEIARESEGLLEINSVMKNIASQTNLLSMNAAIEAAHAGEAGKGFAVVADEIRKLAESSSDQSKTIGMVLKKMKESIDKITRSTGNVLSRFNAIDSSVRTVAEQEDNIRDAMREQEEGSKQVLEGIGNVNEITQQVQSGSQQMLDGSREVINESKNLTKSTEEITAGMNEMSAGAEQINAAVSRVNEICGQNRENIELLVKEVSRFKVE